MDKKAKWKVPLLICLLAMGLHWPGAGGANSGEGRGLMADVVVAESIGTCWDDANECVGQAYGDATCDGSVNYADLAALKVGFGRCAPYTSPHCCADFTQDGCVNLADLFALKAGFFSGPYVPSTGNQDCAP